MFGTGDILLMIGYLLVIALLLYKPIAVLFRPSASRLPPSLFDLSRLANLPRGCDENTPLGALELVVFDTETTGFKPSRGDEMVQLAAVRTTGGTLTPDSGFDRLSRPSRRIPVESTLVHGITDDMVADAAPCHEVTAAFHQFTASRVLVAHHADFDMAFLAKHGGRAAVRFHQPVLDTMLLAYVINPGDHRLSLDAVAERFGVDIHNRHSAMGDATATAEIFARMLKPLQAAGVSTLGWTAPPNLDFGCPSVVNLQR